MTFIENGMIAVERVFENVLASNAQQYILLLQESTDMKIDGIP